MNQGFLPKHLPLKMVLLAGRHPKSVLGVSLILLAAALFFARRITIDADMLAMIPEENRVVRTFRDTITQFGSTDMLLVALEIDDSAPLEAYTDYADNLAERMRARDDIRWVEYRLQDFAKMAEGLLPYATLFMTEAELDTFLARLEPDGLQQHAENLVTRLQSPRTTGLESLIVKDPLGIVPILSERSGLEALGPRFHAETGYLIDGEESLLLMLVKPTGAAADVPFGRRLLDQMADIRQAADQDWTDEDWGAEPPNVIYGGGYPIAVAEGRLILEDMKLGIVFSLLGVVFLFTFSFRRWTAPLVSGLPLLMGLLITFGFVAITVNKINAATSAFAALLIGLGVDFIIVLYGRYLEERARGGDHEAGLTAFGRHTASGVLLGAVTTAATFFAFLISDFKGLSELGLLTGAGILILVITVFFVLPALLTLLERRQTHRFKGLRSYGLEKPCRLGQRYSWPTLTGFAVVTLVLGVAMLGARYDDDVLNMRSPDNPGLMAQEKIMDAFGIRFTPMMVRIDGETEADTLRTANDVVQQLAPLADDGTIARIDSLVSIFPNPDQQRQVVDRLARFERTPAAIRADLRAAFDAAGLNPAPFMPNADPVLNSLNTTDILLPSDMQDTALAPLFERYITELDNGHYAALIYCYMPAGKWRRQAPPPLENIVDQYDNVALTGPVIVSIELKKVVLEDAIIAAIIGTIIVLLFLIWDLGGIWVGVLALLPLLVGLVWTIGAMTWMDIPVNFMNIFVFTMIIGIGVDYGIHLVHRWLETGGDLDAIEGTSRAIVVAALTTIIGFGSLALSHYPGLQSMGLVAIFGAATTAFASVMLLPALMTRFPNLVPDHIAKKF